MKTSLISLLLLPFTAACLCQAQITNDDGVPATSNVPGARHPRIHTDLSVTFRFHAPKAQSVGLQLDQHYDLERDTNGDWTVTTRSQTSRIPLLLADH